MTVEGGIFGLGYYWSFEDSCWIISNLGVATPAFVRECIEAFEMLFAADRLEHEIHLRVGADMRRVFARRNAIIPIVGRDGAFFAVEPRTHVVRPATPAEFPAFGPFKGEVRPAAAAE